MQRSVGDNLLSLVLSVMVQLRFYKRQGHLAHYLSMNTQCQVRFYRFKDRNFNYVCN